MSTTLYLRPVRNAAWGENEVELSSLPIGGRFRQVAPGRITVGTVLDIYQGCVLVKLDGKAETVHIRDVEFVSRRSRNTYWAPESPVEYLGQIEVEVGDVEVGDVESSEASSSDQNSDSEDIIMPGRPKGSKNKPKSNVTTATATPARKSRAAHTHPKHGARLPVATAAQAELANGPAPKVGKSPEVAGGKPYIAPAPAPLDPMTRALFARWKMAVEKLSSLLAIHGPTDQANSQRDRIRAIYDEAVVHQVLLPAFVVTYADPIFADMELDQEATAESAAAAARPAAPGGTGGAPSTTGATVTPAAQHDATGTQHDEFKLTSEENTDMEKKQRKSAAAKANGVKVARTRKSKDKHPCLCGCGTPVGGNFAQGHDARYKGMILRVERGELKESELPAAVRQFGGKDGEPLKFRSVADGMKCVNSVVAAH